MSENIILQKDPKIEFRLLEDGFKLIDEQSAKNSGFYAYDDLKSIELNKVWFPILAKWLRWVTWILNSGVPFFPDAKSYKKSNIILNFKKTNLGIWLTDTYMTDNAIKLKKVLDYKTNRNNIG